MENDYQNDDFIRYNRKKVKKETRGLAAYFCVNIPLYILVLFFAVFFAWYLVFVNTHLFYAVSGPSMMPILNNGITQSQLLEDSAQNISYDAVYVDLSTSPKIFDMVVFNRPTNTVIKRLMAQEGDFITIAQTQDSSGRDVLRFYRIPAGKLEQFTQNPLQTDQMAMMIEDGTQTYGQNTWKLFEPQTTWTHLTDSQPQALQEKTAILPETSIIGFITTNAKNASNNASNNTENPNNPQITNNASHLATPSNNASRPATPNNLVTPSNSVTPNNITSSASAPKKLLQSASGQREVTNLYEYNFCNRFLAGYGTENPPYTYFTSAQGLIYVQVPQGKCFCMGDNRAHSTDSRENGFVDVGQIVGRSEFVVYNFNFGNRILEVIKFYFREIEKFFAR